MKTPEKDNQEKRFVIFPSFGYWEIDGKPVSSEEAQAGLHPRAIWRLTEIGKHPERFY